MIRRRFLPALVSSILASAALAGDGQVTLPLVEWRAIEDEIERLEQPPSPPVSFALASRGVIATFSRGVLRGSIDVDVVVYDDKQVLVPLIDAAASLTEVVVDGQRAVAVREDGRSGVLITGSGRHSARIAFALGEEQDRFERAFELNLPPAPRSRLSLLLPERDLDVRLQGGVILDEQVLGSSTHIEGAVDASGHLVVQWARRVLHTTGEKRELESRLFTLAQLGEEVVTLKTIVAVRVVAGEADRLEFVIPKGLEVVAASGPAVLQWFSKGDKDAASQNLVILLKHIVDDECTVTVETQMPRAQSGPTTLAFLSPADSRVREGFVAIEGRAGFEVKPVALEGGASAVDVGAREIPQRLLDLSDKPLLFGYRYEDKPPAIGLDVKANAQLDLTQAVIDELQVSTVVVEKGTEITKLKLAVRNNTRQYLSMEMPADAVITHALIDGAPFHPAVGEGNTLLLPLRQSEKLSTTAPRRHLVQPGETLGGISLLYFNKTDPWQAILSANPEMSTQNDLVVGRAITIPLSAGGVTLEESSFVLEIAYKVPAPPLGVLGRRGLLLPRLDIPVMAATWHLYLPASVEPLSFDSNLKQMNLIRYDPLRRLQHFVDAALRIQGAWADSGKYENILSNRKAIYRKEQSRAVEEPLSSFPLVGERHRFEQVLMGERQGGIDVVYLKRAVQPGVHIAALLLSIAVVLRLARRASSTSQLPSTSWLSAAAPAAVVLLFLALLGHYVLGVHRMMLVGTDLAILATVARPLSERWRDRAIVGLARPLPIAALTRMSTVAKAVVVLVVLLIALKMPLLLTSFSLVVLLIVTVRLRRVAGASAGVVAFFFAFAGHAQEVKIPLAEYEQSRAKMVALQRKEAQASIERPVVVGETRYAGKSDGRSLRLTLTLRAQLASSNAWKSVPVIGTDAIVVGATRGGQPVPLVADGAYWVWNTRDQGTVELNVDVVIPPRGPRGSLEYAFHSVESPVTEVNCFFPSADLDPQVSGALTNETTPKNGGIALAATLRPTAEIHMVGFHDIEQGAEKETRQAKLYSETESLVSLSDDVIDVFVVVKLTILYASQQRFRMQLPADYDVVSANGEGAFQYTVTDGVLVGETAFPIKQNYEISLRLKRALAATEQTLSLPVLKMLDVERDTGTVAVEIPGKLSIAGASGAGLLPIDVRELPSSLVESSVSPIVKAFRYAGQRDEAKLQLARFPEKALAPGGIDNVKATSVVTEDGGVMTDLSFTIRNNVQQYLALKLPEGALVRSAVLEGKPIKPSKDDAGRVLVPLMRSRSGGGTLKPFHVQLVYESQLSALGSVGSRSLTLPVLEVPVSSLSWGIYVPSRYVTSGLKGAVEPEEFVRNATFTRGRVLGNAGEDAEEDDNGDDNGLAGFGGDSAELRDELGVVGNVFGDENAAVVPAVNGSAAVEDASGAMPVRVQLPTTGKRLLTTRYWLDAQEPLTVSFRYARIPVILLAEALLGLLCSAAFAAGFASALSRRARSAFVVVGVFCAAILLAKMHLSTVVLSALVAAAVVVWRSGSWRSVVTSLADILWLNRDAGETWLRERRDREVAVFAERRQKSLLLAVVVPGLQLMWMSFKIGVLFIVGVALTTQLVAFADLLMNPL